MATLSITFLGSFQLARADTVLTGIESDKTRALLAVLAMEAGRAYSREALATLLWPDAPTARGRKNLRQALHNLRQVLEDDKQAAPHLLADRQSIRFNPDSDYHLDVAALLALLHVPASERSIDLHARPDCVARWRHAVEVYQGNFLDGCVLTDSESFEEWRLFKQEELHIKMVEVLTLLADYDIACDDYLHATQSLYRLIELEPWAEEAHRELMRLHARHGARGAALHQYQFLTEILTEQLQLEPDDETQALYRRIKHGDFQCETGLGRNTASPNPSDKSDANQDTQGRRNQGGQPQKRADRSGNSRPADRTGANSNNIAFRLNPLARTQASLWRYCQATILAFAGTLALLLAEVGGTMSTLYLAMVGMAFLAGTATLLLRKT